MTWVLLTSNSDGFVKSDILSLCVIPVKTGIQCLTGSRLSPGQRLDTGFRRYDKFFDFLQ
jgi:hypothetical protein